MPCSYPRFDGTQACADGTAAEAAAFAGLADSALARRLCAGCRFMAPCLTYALDHDVVGVWGGTDDIERRALRSAAGDPPPTPASVELDALVNAWRAHRPDQLLAAP